MVAWNRTAVDTRHQARGQRRPAWAVGVDGAEALFEERPIDAARQLRRRMGEVDDLVEPCA
jgi:hypothetical protein